MPDAPDELLKESSGAPTVRQLEQNLQCFLFFRIFFNARFYYPVFTILFLDYGLTLEQFSILNVVWAITIVLAEVPSGALADLVGRRNLIVFAALLMVGEMLLLTFAPMGGSSWLFMVMCLNRIFSGLAEAAASGADEALAYDSLDALGRKEEWSQFLEKLTRWQSLAFFTAMLSGALFYDGSLLRWGGVLLGMEVEPGIWPHRLPAALTLLTSLVVLGAALRMREPPLAKDTAASGGGYAVVRNAFRQIGTAAVWTLGNRFVFFVILAGVVLDSVARQLAILGSEYYRAIEIPTVWFGVIGAVMSLLGVVYARLARVLVDHFSPLVNFCILSAVLLVGLLGVSMVLPYIGVVFMAMAFSVLGLVQFHQSHYLNREVDSRQRATVLSFRGLAMNLALGVNSLVYSGWIVSLEHETAEAESTQTIFAASLRGFPVYFLALWVLLMIAGRIFIRSKERLHQV